MGQLSKEGYLNFLKRCAENCPRDYCFLRMLLSFMHTDPRMVCQIKLIEKMKWVWSQEIGKDFGWEESAKRWEQDGWAEIFAKIYDENDDFETSYKKLTHRFNRK